MCKKKKKEEIIEPEVNKVSDEQAAVQDKEYVAIETEAPAENDYFQQYYKAYKNDYISMYLKAYKAYKKQNPNATINVQIDPLSGGSAPDTEAPAEN